MSASVARLTLHSLELRVVAAPLRRPIVSNPVVGRFTEWPSILLDLRTHEGVVGRAYLEPYVLGSARYIVPAIVAAAERLRGLPLAPIDAYRGSATGPIPSSPRRSMQETAP